MKSEREESMGYDNREPKGQEEYAKTQHDLCCQELGLEPHHDREGDTLLESVCRMKRHAETINSVETLAMEWEGVGLRFTEKDEEAYQHRGEIFLECSRRVREILGQNAEVAREAGEKKP